MKVNKLMQTTMEISTKKGEKKASFLLTIERRYQTVMQNKIC